MLRFFRSSSSSRSFSAVQSTSECGLSDQVSHVSLFTPVLWQMLVPGLNWTLVDFLKRLVLRTSFTQQKMFSEKFYSCLTELVVTTTLLQLIIISQVLLVNCFIHKL